MSLVSFSYGSFQIRMELALFCMFDEYAIKRRSSGNLFFQYLYIDLKQNLKGEFSLCIAILVGVFSRHGIGGGCGNHCARSDLHRGVLQLDPDLSAQKHSGQNIQICEEVDKI